MANSPAIYGAGGYAQLLNPQPGTINSDGSFNKNDGPWNYMPNNQFQQNIAGTAAYTIPTVTAGIPSGAPTLGSGSITANYSTAAGNILRGVGVFVASGPFASGSAIGFPAFTVLQADLGRVLTYSFTYNILTGGANANFSGILGTQTLQAYVWDVTNSVWIQPTGFLGINQRTGSGVLSGTFQSSVTSGQQYQLFLMAGASGAGALSVAVSDLFVGPQSKPYGVPVTDWVNGGVNIISGTVSAPTKGSTTVDQVFWRRVGGTMEVRIEFNESSAGTGGSGDFLFQIPGSYSVDLTKMTQTTSSSGGNGPAFNSVCGSVYIGLPGQQGLGNVHVYDATHVRFSVSFPTVTAAGQFGTSFYSLSNVASFVAYYSVPIAGWSSNVQMSSDTDTRVVQATVGVSTAVSATGGTIIPFNVVLSDTHGGYSTGTGIYTVPVSGYYRISTVLVTNGSGSSFGQLYVNGSVTAYICNVATGSFNGGAITVLCNAGDRLAIVSAASVGFAGQSGAIYQNYASFDRISGPSTIAATESINARYFSASNAITGTLATVNFATKGWDTHSAYLSGVYTIPTSGKYQVNAGVAMTGTFILNSLLDFQIQQTGSATQITEEKVYAGGALTQMAASASDEFQCNAGDTIRVQASNSGTSPVLATGNTQNYFSISRIGN